MSKFKEYLEAVKKVVDEPEEKYDFETKQEMDALKQLPGSSSQDKILNFLKIKSEWGGTLRHGNISEKMKKFGIYYQAADEDEGGMLGFDPSKYPGVNVDSLKQEYLKTIGAKATTEFWPDDETKSELPKGYIGFAWGDPNY